MTNIMYNNIHKCVCGDKMFSKIKSQGLTGLNGFDVVVEADISRGLPRFDLVGLPDAAVKESRERVRASIKNCGYKFPADRITVNIAPADIKKEGAIYDLPILISILAASGQIFNTEGYSFIGELSLSGEIRSANGVLPMVIQAKESGTKAIFVPYENAQEGAVVDGISVLPVKSIGDYLAAQALVETYGVKVDPELHREVLERYQKLNLAPYKGFINPVYRLVTDADGNPTDVTIDYTEGYADQMLRYSRDYRTLPLTNN